MGVVADHNEIMTPAAKTPEQKQKQYPSGMAQPACFAVSASGEILYKWVLQPEQSNFFGAKTRARPADSWSIIKALVEGKQPPINEAQIDAQNEVTEILTQARNRAKASK